jgi:hypothetical protein
MQALAASAKARRAAAGVNVVDLPAAPEACPVCEERKRRDVERKAHKRERKAQIKAERSD